MVFLSSPHTRTWRQKVYPDFGGGERFRGDRTTRCRDEIPPPPTTSTRMFRSAGDSIVVERQVGAKSVEISRPVTVGRLERCRPLCLESRRKTLPMAWTGWKDERAKADLRLASQTQRKGMHYVMDTVTIICMQEDQTIIPRLAPTKAAARHYRGRGRMTMNRRKTKTKHVPTCELHRHARAKHMQDAREKSSRICAAHARSPGTLSCADDKAESESSTHSNDTRERSQVQRPSNHSGQI